MAKDLMIGIGAEFRGAQAFKQADSAIMKLNKAAKALGVAFGARQLLRYTTNAVKAFAADDNAARSLGMTLENLNLSFGGAAKSVNDYISNLERQTGVLDDELRPAMDRFLRATYDVAKSQELLSLALDISAGTGKDLTAVSQALQKAYLGQTQSLGRLGVGLSKAELTSSTFLELQQKLSTLFAGQAASAADSYQGSLNKLTVAMNNFKEAAGKGIIEGLTGAGGAGGLDSVVGAIERAGAVVGDLAVGLGRTANILGMFFGNRSFGDIRKQLQAFREADMRSRQQYGGVYATQYQKQAAALAKKQADNTKKQLAATKALTKAQSDALKEKKLAGIFDQEQIQIMAALQGKITDEERKRLELMLAVQQGNVNEAQRLANELANIQGKTSMLATYLRTLPDAKNPFASWSDYLKAIEQQIRLITGGGSGGGAGVSGVNPYDIPQTNASYMNLVASESAAFQAAQQQIQIAIEVQGGDAVTELMRYKIIEASSSGSGVNWSQTVGAYDR